MESNLKEENAIDLETLQAQIDLSMAFAQDMVSSWVKNNHKLPSRPRDADTELKDYLKRPPRLGVGAAVPENSVSSRDVARLKGQLTDKKRQREDEVQFKKENSDDEGESRGGAIKKKVRVDPFQVGGKKNKDKRPFATPFKHTDKPTPVVKAEPEPTQGVPNSVQDLQMTPKKAGKPTTNHSPLIPTSLPPLDLSPSKASPIYARRLARSAELLKGPVLNLDEPESEGDGSDDNAPNDPSEHKKKRKRRKKKKKHSNSMETTSVA